MGGDFPKVKGVANGSGWSFPKVKLSSSGLAYEFWTRNVVWYKEACPLATSYCCVCVEEEVGLLAGVCDVRPTPVM